MALPAVDTYAVASGSPVYGGRYRLGGRLVGDALLADLLAGGGAVGAASELSGAAQVSNIIGVGGMGTYASVTTLGGTNLTALNPCPGGGCDYTNGRSMDSIITSWCSTPAIRAPGHEGFIAFGGGHAGWAGNDVYRFDLAGTDPGEWGWSRVSTPTTPLFASTADLLNPPTDTKDYRADAEYGEYYNTADTLSVYGGSSFTDSAGTTGISGQVSAAHTYSVTTWVPGGTILGDDPKGYLYTRSNSRMMTAQSGASGWSHYIGMSNDGAANYWMRGTKAWTGFGRFGWSIFDPARNLIVAMDGPDAGAKSNLLGWHDLNDDTYGTGLLVNPAGGIAPRPETGYASAYYWESKDLYLKLGGGSGWDICLIEPVTRRAWFVTTDFPRPWTGAWAWVEEHQVAIWYGTGRDVYILRPPADPIGTPWTWELYTLPDGPDPLAEVPVATAHPYFNRLIYWPHLARFSWCSTGSGNVQLFSVPL